MKQGKKERLPHLPKADANNGQLSGAETWPEEFSKVVTAEFASAETGCGSATGDLATSLNHGLEDYPKQVPLKTRVSRGQFFTPREVCDLMLAWSLEDTTSCLLEPGCGAGAFLVRALERLHYLRGFSGTQTAQLPDVKLCGIDIDPQAAQLCAGCLRAMNLDRSAEADVLIGDFLSETFPGFFLSTVSAPNLIIGNPPYVRYEHLKQNPAWDSAKIAQVFESAYASYLERCPDQKPLFSGRNDLSVWFLLQSTRLLAPGGQLAFIISRGWLETSQGQYLRRFLLDYYTPLALMESAVEPWFEDAAINPLILILRRRDECEALKADAMVRLIRFEQPLSQWLPCSGSDNYWQVLDQTLAPLRQGASVEAAKCRMVTVSQLDEDCRRSWFWHWRTPQSLLSSFASPADRWVALEALGRVRYPVKTGINHFFYVNDAVIDRFGIEPEFLKPVVKSAKSISKPEIFFKDLQLYLFSCLHSKEELAQNGKTGALSYIQWGEAQEAPSRQKRSRPVPWPEVSSVQGRPFWYAMPSIPPADILCSRFFDRRFFFVLCREPVVEDQTFYGLVLRPEYAACRDFLAGLLNALPTLLMTELCGRSSLGEGVLQLSREDMARLPVPNPALWDETAREEIAECFRAIGRRPICSIEIELTLQERQSLDRAVLAGLFPEKSDAECEALQNEWGQALIQRVHERTGMAAKRRKRQTG